MRELVYMSQAKLDQFQKETSRLDYVPRITSAEYRGVKIETPARSKSIENKLDKTISHLHKSVKWYSSSDVHTGEWVQFQALVNYEILHYRSADSDENELLLLWSVLALDEVTLLLHGSPSNLIEAFGIGASQPGTLKSLPPSTQLGILSALRSLGGDDDRNDLMWQLSKLMKKLRDDVPDSLSSPMGGIARITAKVKTVEGAAVVIATPLYVERQPRSEVVD